MEIGLEYETACAELIWKEDERVYFVPVFNHPHADPAFDFPLEHFHIDGRFGLHPRMRHWFRLENGHTSVVILSKGTDSYRFNRIINKPLKYLRNDTGLIIPPVTKKYEEWYQTFLGKACHGRKCPHFGTSMLERDGLLICPLHNLTADSHTLQVIAKPDI